jgi:hypothetical protein
MSHYEQSERRPATANIRDQIVAARVGLLLLGEARYRLTKRLFGVSRPESPLLALVLLVVFGDAVVRTGRRVRSIPRRPSAPEALFAAAAVKEASHRLAGPSSRDTEDFGMLVSIVVAAAIGRGLMGPPARSVRAASVRVRGRVTRIFGGLLRAFSASPTVARRIPVAAQAGDRPTPHSGASIDSA